MDTNAPAPIPCAHCGINFMRRDLALDAPKICNSCIQKQKLKVKKGEKPVNEMQIIIKCTQEEHAKIEELCMNEGINYTEYFMGLHEHNTQSSYVCAPEEPIEYGLSQSAEVEVRNHEIEEEKPKKKKKKA